MIKSLTSKRFLATSITMVLLIAMLPTAQAGAPPSITPGQCGSMDLVFIIDTTGSMLGEINNVQSGLGAIIAEAQLASQGNQLRLGLITFDGTTTVNTYGQAAAPFTTLNDFVRVEYPLTTDVAAVQAAIADTTVPFPLDLGFGGSGPEATDMAKATALGLTVLGLQNDAAGVQGLVINNPATAPGGWNVASFGATTNIAILVTDAEAGGFNDIADGADDVNMQTLGTIAGANVPPIRMSDIYSGLPSNTLAVTQLTADAVNSGGIFIQGPTDGSDTASAIMSIIAECGGEMPMLGIGGEIQPINTTSLLIAGAGANAALLIPIIAGIAGVGAYFTRSLWNKSEE